MHIGKTVSLNCIISQATYNYNTLIIQGLNSFAKDVVVLLYFLHVQLPFSYTNIVPWPRIYGYAYVSRVLTNACVYATGNHLRSQTTKMKLPTIRLSWLSWLFAVLLWVL